MKEQQLTLFDSDSESNNLDTDTMQEGSAANYPLPTSAQSYFEDRAESDSRSGDNSVRADIGYIAVARESAPGDDEDIDDLPVTPERLRWHVKQARQAIEEARRRKDNQYDRSV